MDMSALQLGGTAMLAPLILSVASLLLMLQIAFWRHATASWLICCMTVVLSMLALLPASKVAPQQVTPILASDQYSLFFSLLILFISLITALLAKDYLKHKAGENEEFYLLLLLSTLGAVILVSSTHLASFLLGLELLGVALYALIAYPERGHLPLEAAIKYLVLSGAASAILLFGFALVYAALGTLSFSGIGLQMAQPIATENQLLILLGTAMVLTGIGFKLSLVPFHMWTPDVYQGAPAPVTGFLATVSKGAIFAALIRLFIDAQLYHYQGLLIGLSVIAIASMLAGNFLALMQDNLKRLLAYSSIAHLGYLLIALVVYGHLRQADLAVEASAFYLTAYVVTTLAAFTVLTIISSAKPDTAKFHDADSDLDNISHIQGLFWQRPLLAILMTVSLLSLAGIPLTIGFIGKFYIFTVGIKGALWILLGALVIGSGIGIYYYLRIVFAMTMKPSQDETNLSITTGFSFTARSVVCLLIFLMLYLGVFPQPLMSLLSS